MSTRPRIPAAATRITMAQATRMQQAPRIGATHRDRICFPEEVRMSAFTDFLSALSAAVSAGAAYWAWQTSREAHALAKSLANKADGDAFQLEIERLRLAAAQIEATSSTLYFSAAKARVQALSKANAGEAGALSNSRLRIFVEGVDDLIADALAATEAVKAFQRDAKDQCGGSIELARSRRIDAEELVVGLRGSIDRLQVDKEGWV